MIKITLIILVVILLAIFCTLNRQEIALQYYWGWKTGPFPLFLLILIFLIAGGVVGTAVGWGERSKLRAKERELKARAKVLQDEVDALTPKEEVSESLPNSAEAPKLPPA